MYLNKNIFQIALGIDPGSNGITEKDEVGHNTGWIHLNHLAHSSESTVLFVVVADVPQRYAPAKKTPLEQYFISSGRKCCVI